MPDVIAPPTRSRRPSSAAFALSALLVLSANAGGCARVAHGVQATWGQWDLQSRAQSRDKLIADPATPPAVRRALLSVPSIESFAKQNGLRMGGSYQAYADLERPAAVWVVTACRPLTFEPHTWSFAGLGSFPYLGWFNLRTAKAFAERLEAAGWDTDVRPARAYSTLGWFDDPLLSTMLSRGSDWLGQLVETILHESFHATLHVPGQGPFNESLASFVGEGLTLEYLRTPRPGYEGALHAYRRALQRQERRVQRMLVTYRELETLYESDVGDERKRVTKAEVLEELRNDLGGGRTLSNATLIDLRTYQLGAPAWESMFDACGRQWSKFLPAVASVTEADFTQDQQESIDEVVSALARRACGPVTIDPHVLGAPGRDPQG